MSQSKGCLMAFLSYFCRFIKYLKRIEMQQNLLFIFVLKMTKIIQRVYNGPQSIQLGHLDGATTFRVMTFSIIYLILTLCRRV